MKHITIMAKGLIRRLPQNNSSKWSKRVFNPQPPPQPLSFADSS